MTGLQPSRRAVLGAGATLLALAAPVAAVSAADPDAALLVVCTDLLRVAAEAVALDCRISALPAPDDQRLFDVCAAPGGIWERQEGLRDLLVTMPARTAAGRLAKARATAAWIEMFHGKDLAEGSADHGVSFAASLARDLIAAGGTV